jgi:hypothetical protein
MRGGISSLPHTPSWSGSQIKKQTQGQLYLLLCLLEDVSNINVDKCLYKKKKLISIQFTLKKSWAKIGYLATYGQLIAQLVRNFIE